MDWSEEYSSDRTIDRKSELRPRTAHGRLSASHSSAEPSSAPPPCDRAPRTAPSRPPSGSALIRLRLHDRYRFAPSRLSSARLRLIATAPLARRPRHLRLAHARRFSRLSASSPCAHPPLTSDAALNPPPRAYRRSSRLSASPPWPAYSRPPPPRVRRLSSTLAPPPQAAAASIARLAPPRLRADRRLPLTPPASVGRSCLRVAAGRALTVVKVLIPSPLISSTKQKL